MWNLGIHIVSTGSESPGLRENQHSVLSANLCTKFKNDSIKNILLKTHLVLPIPVEIICTYSTCLSNSINTFIFSFRDRKKNCNKRSGKRLESYNLRTVKGFRNHVIHLFLTLLHILITRGAFETCQCLISCQEFPFIISL